MKDLLHNILSVPFATATGIGYVVAGWLFPLYAMALAAVGAVAFYLGADKDVWIARPGKPTWLEKPIR